MVAAWIEKHYRAVLIAILVFAFASRLYRLDTPKEYIFDEVYHSVTAKLIHRNDPRAFEWWNPPVEPNTAVDWLHPPLAKYTQAIGMSIFGENAYGWRISSAVFGVGVIWLTAVLALQLFQKKSVSLLAALLASLDGLLLVQSRIAMNDIHVAFAILLALWCYVKFWQSSSIAVATPKTAKTKKKSEVAQPILTHKVSLRWLFATGLSVGLALGSKWSGFFVLMTVWVFEMWRMILNFAQLRTQRLLRPWVVSRVLLLLILPICIYLLSYTHMFLQGKSLMCEGNKVQQGQCYCSQKSSWWVGGLKTILPANIDGWEKLEARGGCKQLISHFAELHHQIWWYQTNLKATHGYQSRPWQWFLNLRPVWMYVKYGNGTIANIYSQGNPELFLLGNIAVAVTIGFLIRSMYYIWKTRQKLSALFVTYSPLSGLCLLLFAFFAVWLPWEMSPRIMFFYHYTPAVPLLCILAAYWLMKLSTVVVEFKSKNIFPVGSLIVILSIVVTGLFFAVFYPNWTGIPVSVDFANAIYFVVKSWK